MCACVCVYFKTEFRRTENTCICESVRRRKSRGKGAIGIVRGGVDPTGHSSTRTTFHNHQGLIIHVCRCLRRQGHTHSHIVKPLCSGRGGTNMRADLKFKKTCRLGFRFFSSTMLNDLSNYSHSFLSKLTFYHEEDGSSPVVCLVSVFSLDRLYTKNRS